MAITQASIENIRQSISLLSVVEKTRAVVRNGQVYRCLCPFHEERTPSFCIYEDSNSYYCFGCQAGGDVISFVMASSGLSFPEAVEYLAQEYNIKLEYSNSEYGGQGSLEKKDKVATALFYRLNLFASKVFINELQRAPVSVRDYVLRRVGSNDLIVEFGIGYAPSSGVLIKALQKKSIDLEIAATAGLIRKNDKGQRGFYEYFRNRLIFPIITDNSDKIVGFGGRIVPLNTGSEEVSINDAGVKRVAKYLNSPESPVYHKSSTLYYSAKALESIRQSGEVYVVEGYLDVISMHRFGVKNVVATCGTSFTEEHARRLSRLARRICLLFDGDVAGYEAACKAIRLVGTCESDIKVVFLPQGEDPDSFAQSVQGDLVERLSKFNREDVFDVYIRREIESFGGEGTKLSPAVKGRIVRDIAQVWNSATPIAIREQVFEMLAYRLGLKGEIVRQMWLSEPGKTIRRSTIVVEKENTTRLEVQEPFSKRDTISNLDRIVLMGVIAVAHNLPSSFLRRSELGAVLSPLALQLACRLSQEASRLGRELTENECLENFRLFFHNNVCIVRTLARSGVPIKAKGGVVSVEFFVNEIYKELSNLKDGAEFLVEVGKAIDRAYLENLATDIQSRIRFSQDESEQRLLLQEHLIIRRKLSAMGRVLDGAN